MIIKGSAGRNCKKDVLTHCEHLKVDAQTPEEAEWLAILRRYLCGQVRCLPHFPGHELGLESRTVTALSMGAFEPSREVAQRIDALLEVWRLSYEDLAAVSRLVVEGVTDGVR